MTRARPALALAVALATTMAGVLLASGCRPGHSRAAAVPPASHGARPVLYVAVGASETVGVGTDNPLRQAWPQVLFRTALPPSAAFVNLGVSGATVQDALDVELPLAQPLHPNLVTVWLNVNDLIAGVPAATYEAELRRLVHGLRAGGATVLVANTPSLDHLPAYLACSEPTRYPGLCPPGIGPFPGPAVIDALVDSYNAATARVAREEGALVADLHGALLAARAAGQEASLVSADGFHPSVAGAALVARVFAAALRTVAPTWPPAGSPPA